MRASALLLLVPLAGCYEVQQANGKNRKAPGEDFAQDHWVRITAPMNGKTMDSDFLVEWTAGEDIAALALEADGVLVREITTVGDGAGVVRVSLDEGAYDLRLVGLDAAGDPLSDHTIRVRVAIDSPWVTLTSPSDGAVVPNPVRFAVEASQDVDQIEILADEWPIGTVAPGDLLTYEFSGTGFERTIDVHAYGDGDLVATDTIRLTITDGTTPTDSSFGDLVMELVDDYPTDGSYDYWWPSSGDWGGNPHDIYYMDELFAAGDPQNRSFCVGLTFEVFMRAFDQVDRAWAGDGTLNGIDFEELYTFRTDWYVRDLYGMGIVDAMDNYGIGSRVTDWDDARAGDFVQFWRQSGSGHNVVFIDWLDNSSGDIVGFTYWSTQGSTGGVGYNDEYFGSSGSNIDPSHFYVGRVADPDDWTPWY